MVEFEVLDLWYLLLSMGRTNHHLNTLLDLVVGTVSIWGSLWTVCADGSARSSTIFEMRPFWARISKISLGCVDFWKF